MVNSEVTMGNDDRKLTQTESREFLKATFFTPEAEMPPPRPVVSKRRSRRENPEIRALRHFVKALNDQPPAHRRATILWLADFYEINVR